MKQQTFFGASDDLVELDGDLLYEEYPCDDAAFVLISPGPEGQEPGAVRVRVFYGQDGTWFTAVAPFDDDTPFPAGFACSIDQDRYTARLTVTVPDDTTIRQIAGRQPDGEPLETEQVG